MRQWPCFLSPPSVSPSVSSLILQQIEESTGNFVMWLIRSLKQHTYYRHFVMINHITVLYGSMQSKPFLPDTSVPYTAQLAIEGTWSSGNQVSLDMGLGDIDQNWLGKLVSACVTEVSKDSVACFYTQSGNPLISNVNFCWSHCRDFPLWISVCTHQYVNVVQIFLITWFAVLQITWKVSRKLKHKAAYMY